jgi:hypothetical protein
MNARSWTAAVCLVAFAVAPASAGLVFKQTMKTEGESGMSQTARVWFDTGGVKMEFLDSDNPMMPAGSYLLMQPDSDVLILVNPEKKTFAEFDLAALTQAVGSMMAGMGAGDPSASGQREQSKPVVEKLLEEEGETILGRPTKHYRYRFQWSTTMTMAPGMAMIIENDSIEDTWVATDLELDPKLARSFEGFAAGLSLPKDVKEIIAAQKQMLHGVPLRRIQKGTTKITGTGMMAMMAKQASKHGSGPTTTTIEVVELSEEKVPASTFAVPAGYTETEMIAPGMKMPDMNRVPRGN